MVPYTHYTKAHRHTHLHMHACTQGVGQNSTNGVAHTNYMGTQNRITRQYIHKHYASVYKQITLLRMCMAISIR